MVEPSEAPRLLIVDDQPRNLDALEVMLAPLACTPVRAGSADEALLLLLRYDVAAIVLDIRMPGMDGLELAQLIKQRRRSRHVPILFLTAHTVTDADVLQGYGVGAVDYLSKPVHPDILRSKVSVFIDLFTKTRALAWLNDALESEVAQRKQAQEALELANEDLERRVQERTAALARAHQGVRENEERLKMALTVAQLAAWEWHLSSGHKRWSTDPEALFGFPAGSFGTELRTLRVVHPDDQVLIEEAVQRALAGGPFEAEFRLRRPDGSVVWITERGQIVRDEDGAMDRMVGISRDITAEKEAALDRERLLRDARDARDEAERQSLLKDEFLASLSHELRTPMNVILGWLSTLDSGKPIRDVYSALAVVRRNAEIQAKLIDDLLDASRLVAGNVQLEMSRVNLGVLLQTATQGLQPTADSKGVQMIAALDANMADVVGDPRRLQQVLWNLLHNAIKFTPRGGRVEVRMQQRDGLIEVTILDTGCGITPEFLPHVFERFRQQDAASSGGTAGLGLGLSIAKQLVELHGGTIRAWSAGPSQGATFAIRIPVANVVAERPSMAGSETALSESA